MIGICTIVSSDSVTFAGNYFTVIEQWSDLTYAYRIVYANDTKIKFLFINGYKRIAITELHNPDGSLQVYEEAD